MAVRVVEGEGDRDEVLAYIEALAEREADDFIFAERLEELNEELEVLNAEARELEERIAENVALLLEGLE